MVKEKLKGLKKQLKVWNKEVFRNLNTKRNGLVLELNTLDRKTEDVLLNVEDVARRKALEAEYWRLSNLNESLLCQKARVNWFKKGDVNTKFFHGMVNWRRRMNSLIELNIYGR